MGPTVLGFSISSQIEQIGAICGFAAILGLAVLSVLYFAQAREVKRLREWAGRAPERDAELQARVTEEAARRTGKAPGTQAAAAPATTTKPATPGGATAAAGAAGVAATAAGAQAGAQAAGTQPATGAQAAAGAQASTTPGTQAAT